MATMSDILSKPMQALRCDRYRIDLEPLFDTATFAGTVVIDAEASEALISIQLHACDLSVTRCRVNDEEIGEFHLDEKTDIFTIPAEVAAGSSCRIELSFTGKLNDRLAGFYPSAMTNGPSAVTQFEERDARRAFPCIDHPGRKSAFEISLVAPSGMVAISNTGVDRIDELDGRRRRFHFLTTPPMSTYLLFFGVGPFDIIEDHSFRIPIRVVGDPAKTASGRKSIEYAREALAFFEEYTGVEYPLDKLDLIGVADFAYGAMENFGAITYRENYIYFDEQATSQTDLEQMAGVTTHEVAHMWFGDLVSPSDWGYVWLNEAFATYFGSVGTDASHPEWRLLEGFVAGAHGATMQRDSLPGTVAIEFEEGTFPEIDPSTAPIIYGKAGAILHMVRDFIGDQRFRSGVHSFLTTHAFESVGTNEFLASFATGAGDDTAQLLERWIRQPGLPVVTAHAAGTEVAVEQHRFVYTGSVIDTVWPVPVTLLALDSANHTTRVDLLLTERTGRVALPADTVAWKLNASQSGFYRVAYDTESLRLLRDSFARWEPLDRAGIVSDLSASFVKGTVTLETVLDFVSHALKDEQHETVVRGLAGLLMQIHTLLPDAREDAAQLLTELLSPVLARLGAVGAANDTPVEARLRPDMLWWLYRAGHADATDLLTRQAKEVKHDAKIPGDLLPVALRAAARERIVDREWFVHRIEAAGASEARRRHLLAGMGWFKREDDLVATLDYAMSSVAQHNLHYPVGAVASNPDAHRLLLPWLERSVEALGKLHGFALGRLVAAVIPHAGLGRVEAMRAFVEANRAHLGAKGPVEMALEQLAVQQGMVDIHGGAK